MAADWALVHITCVVLLVYAAAEAAFAWLPVRPRPRPNRLHHIPEQYQGYLITGPVGNCRPRQKPAPFEPHRIPWSRRPIEIIMSTARFGMLFAPFGPGPSINHHLHIASNATVKRSFSRGACLALE